MKSILNTIFATLVLSQLSQAIAQTQEFLSPVAVSEEATVRANNEYFLKKETYFAKRYRIVTVNTELLLDADRIRISLFDDASATLQVSNVDVQLDGLGIAWTGNLIEPSVTFDDLKVSGLSNEEATNILPYVNSLSISAGQISFDVNRGLKYPYYSPVFKRFLNAAGKGPLYDVVFLLQSPSVQGSYELRPLAGDPHHHVLVELDPDKLFAQPIEPIDPNSIATNPDALENSAKHQSYLSFLDALGPDPRPIDMHKE